MSGIKDKGHFDLAYPQPSLGSNIPLLQKEIVLPNYFACSFVQQWDYSFPNTRGTLTLSYFSAFLKSFFLFCFILVVSQQATQADLEHSTAQTDLELVITLPVS